MKSTYIKDDYKIWKLQFLYLVKITKVRIAVYAGTEC